MLFHAVQKKSDHILNRLEKKEFYSVASWYCRELLERCHVTAVFIAFLSRFTPIARRKRNIFRQIGFLVGVCFYPFSTLMIFSVLTDSLVLVLATICPIKMKSSSLLESAIMLSLISMTCSVANCSLHGFPFHFKQPRPPLMK